MNSFSRSLFGLALLQTIMLTCSENATNTAAMVTSPTNPTSLVQTPCPNSAPLVRASSRSGLFSPTNTAVSSATTPTPTYVVSPANKGANDHLAKVATGIKSHAYTDEALKKQAELVHEDMYISARTTSSDNSNTTQTIPGARRQPRTPFQAIRRALSDHAKAVDPVQAHKNPKTPFNTPMVPQKAPKITTGAATASLVYRQLDVACANVAMANLQQAQNTPQNDTTPQDDV